jgi:hypothetical protein
MAAKVVWPVLLDESAAVFARPEAEAMHGKMHGSRLLRYVMTELATNALFLECKHCPEVDKPKSKFPPKPGIARTR